MASWNRGISYEFCENWTFFFEKKKLYKRFLELVVQIVRLQFKHEESIDVK